MSATKPRRLLLVTYEFPPSAGGGVQRVANFAKHLPSAGWRVDVLCAAPIEGRPRDDSLLARVDAERVVRLPARHIGVAIAGALAPLKRLRRRSGRAAAEGSPSGPAVDGAAPLSTRLARWIAVPDPAVLWARDVPAAAAAMHAEEPFDAVLASGPPYSGVAAAARAARSLGVPFVADMRDAWLVNPSVRWPTAWHRRRSSAMAGRTIGAADAAIAVSEPIAAEARELGAARVLVLPNGFDPDDLPPLAPDRSAPLRLAFMGRLYGAVDPYTLMRGVGLAVSTGRAGAGFALDVVGPPSPEAEELARRFGAQGAVRFHGFAPHAEALALVARADVAVVSIGQRPGAEAVYTGKLFEYLGMGVPVLVIGPPHGAAAALVREARAGWVSPADDAEALAEMIERVAQAKRSGTLEVRPDADVVGRFDRRRQAESLAAILDEAMAARSIGAEEVRRG